jgi:fructose-specific phosphotransferase system IIA component
MSLDDLLDASLIAIHLGEGNKFQIIEELLDLAVNAGKVHNRERALKDLIEREQYLSTGFENGLAVPHAKSEAVSEMVLVFGLNKEGVDFDSLDGKPTHFIFLLLSPMDTSGPHIQTLALLARNFQKPDTINMLKNAVSVDEIIRILKDFK